MQHHPLALTRTTHARIADKGSNEYFTYAQGNALNDEQLAVLAGDRNPEDSGASAVDLLERVDRRRRGSAREYTWLVLSAPVRPTGEALLMVDGVRRIGVRAVLPPFGVARSGGARGHAREPVADLLCGLRTAPVIAFQGVAKVAGQPA